MPPDLAPTPANTPDQAYYRQVLHDLIDMGTDLARQVHSQATCAAEAPAAEAPAAEARAAEAPAAEAPAAALPPHPKAEPPDATIAFDRIARAIRRSIVLARHIAEARPTPAATQAATQAAPHATIARRRILREVEDVIQRTATGARADSLHAETLDRLDGPDLADDIGHLPVATIVADICRDLGIAATNGARPWKRRTPDDIALLCARAAQPNAPGTGTNTLLPFLKPPGRRPP